MHRRSPSLSDSSRRAFPRRVVGLAIALSVFLGVACLWTGQAQADEVSPITARGFELYASKWVLPDEIQLKNDVQALGEVVRRVVPLKRQLDLAVADNAQMWQKQQAAGRLIDQIAKALRRNAVGTDEEKRIQRQIDQLKKATQELKDGVAPDRLGGQPHVRSLLESLTLYHQQASLLMVDIQQRAGKVQETYGSLTPDEQQWLAEHPEFRLGPLQRPEMIDQALRKARAHLALEQVPFYLHGEQKRVGVLINDQVPAIVSLQADDDRVIVTSNMAQAAGLRPNVAAEEIQLPGGQVVQARKTRLPRLRLGPATIHDVDVVVLQPHDEHLGGFIGLKLFQAWNPELADSGVAVTVDPTSRVSTAAR